MLWHDSFANVVSKVRNLRIHPRSILKFLVLSKADTIEDIISPSDLMFSINTAEMKSISGLDCQQRKKYYKMTAIVENKYYPKSWTREPGFSTAGY